MCALPIATQHGSDVGIRMSCGIYINITVGAEASEMSSYYILLGRVSESPSATYLCACGDLQGCRIPGSSGAKVLSPTRKPRQARHVGTYTTVLR